MKTLAIALLLSLSLSAQSKHIEIIQAPDGKYYRLMDKEDRIIFGRFYRDKFYLECNKKGKLKKNGRRKVMICELKKASRLDKKTIL